MTFFKRILVTVAILLGLGFGPAAAPVRAEAAQGQETVLVQMFRWWNAAIQDPDGFTREAFGRYFTEDGAIMINGKVAVKGLDDLVTHFRAIQKRVEYVEIVMPFEEEFVSASGDRIFTYHLIKSRADGKDGLMHAMGYADIRDGKIALIHLVRAEAEPESAGSK